MLELLLIACLASPVGMVIEEPPKHEAAKVEHPKPEKKRPSVAVPEEPPTAKEKAAPVPKSTPKPKPAPPAIDTKRLAEAEARAKRLTSENAKLQEALARKELPTGGEIRNPAEALAELREGNRRFVEGHRIRSLLASQDPDLRQTLTKGQAPFAVIVTCSDSRLMDNYIFDQELGRLFTIREAGNCPDTQGVASVEYAVEHLGSKVVVVLGHTACGAIKAVAEANGKPLPGNLWSFQAAMSGLLETTHEDPNETAAEHLRHLERNNAVRQAQVVLDRSEIVRHLVSIGKVKVLPAVYDLATGQVLFLELPKPAKAGESAHH